MHTLHLTDIDPGREIPKAPAPPLTVELSAITSLLRGLCGIPDHYIGVRTIEIGQSLKRFVVFTYERRDSRELHGMLDISATFDTIDEVRAYCASGDHNRHDVFDCEERMFVDFPHDGARKTGVSMKRFVVFSFKRLDRGSGACDVSGSFDTLEEARAHHMSDYSFWRDVLDCDERRMADRIKPMPRNHARHNRFPTTG